MIRAPRKKRAYAQTDNYISSDIERFLDNNLVAIKRNLIHSYGYKLNNNITWTPEIQDVGTTPKPKGYGSNNTHYVVPKIKSIFGGRSPINKNPTWQDVESEAKKIFNLSTDDDTPTRNIDYWRKIDIGGQEYCQACEVKKTTGSYDKPPVFIRSSEAQLEALTTYESVKINQIGPSIYLVGSCDYDVSNKWQITWWFVPAKSSDDFLCFNTSNFPMTYRTTRTNDGWIKPDGRHIGPPTV